MKLTAAVRPWTRIRAESSETEYDYECWSDGAPPPRPPRSASSWTLSREPTAPDFLEPPRLVDWRAPPAPESAPRLSLSDVPSRTSIREGEPSLPPENAPARPRRSSARRALSLIVFALASAALGAWIARDLAAPRPMAPSYLAAPTTTNMLRSSSAEGALERPPIAWGSPAPSVTDARRLPQANGSDTPARPAPPTRTLLARGNASTSLPVQAPAAATPPTAVRSPASARDKSAVPTRASSEQAAAELGSSLLLPNAVGTQAASACQ